MKFKKREKILLNILVLLLLFALNFNLIYKPMKDKEKQLINNKNTIKVSKKILNENKLDNTSNEDNILTIENYLKQKSTVDYIKKETSESNSLNLSVRINGLSSNITDIINNIDKISKKIYFNNIEIVKIDEENVECKFKITIYNA